MLSEPLYSAAVCTPCRHVSLLADDSDDTLCAVCSTPLLFLPGVKFVAGDLRLFAELERIVYDAELSRSDAALIAADLEGVSIRWEPPDLVLAHLSARLPGLSAVYDSKQDYSRLLLVVGMLLTIVGSRLAFDTVAPSQNLRSSGIRELAPIETGPRARLLQARGKQSK